MSLSQQCFMADDLPYSKAWFAAHFARTSTKQAQLYHALNDTLGAGLTRDKVSKLVNGIRNPQADELPIIWQFFGVTEHMLSANYKQVIDTKAKVQPDVLFVKDDPDLPGPDVVIGEVKNFPAVGPRDLPLMQSAEGGDDGDLIMTDQIVEYLRRPASLAGQRVFAAYVAGDSMTPRYEPGEPVYAYYARPVSPGDYVILEMVPRPGSTDRRGFIKRLTRRTARAWICEQFNPPGPVEYPTDQVIKVYRVVPPKELYG